MNDREFWDQNGFLVLQKFYSLAEIDVMVEAQDHVWATRAPRILVDDLVTGERLPLAEVTDDARKNHRFKTNDLYLEVPEIRAAALNERIVPILRDLLGHTPVICNSLSFEFGSAQTAHVDSIFMTPQSPGHLIAVWIALEDCDNDAGPLFYYPGSHVIPPYIFSTGGRHCVLSEMAAWEAYIAEQVETLGLKRETFAARMGDVFIWSAELLHGGFPINKPNLTRKSLVFHYFSEDDAHRLNMTLQPQAGAFWQYRRHTGVGGSLGEMPPPVY